jgi:membrane-associated phospholipid phosphatase
MAQVAADGQLDAQTPVAHAEERPAPPLRAVVGPLAVELLAVYVLLTACWVGLGFLVTGPLAGTAVADTDRDVATWLVENRTPTLDDWSHVGGMLADTLVKIMATAIIAGIMLLVWRSWREPFIVAAALVLEASVFITTTWIVGRPRPDVERLDTSPVGSSFPSGHVAAAVAYGAIAVVVFERVRNRVVRAVVVVVVVAVPIIVAWARMYRGMHYLTDVIAGVLLGAASVLAVVVVVRRADAHALAKTAPTRPGQ